MTKKNAPIGVILAGGDGRRLNQGPKPMVMLAGQSLLQHVIARLKPQTETLVLSVRANAPWAHDTGLETVQDARDDAGPAAGIAAALHWAHPKAPTILTCPADCPFLPDDLSSLFVAALDDTTDIVVAASGTQRHHLIALWRTALAERISALLTAEGAMAIQALQSRFHVRAVTWPTIPHDPFFNINTPADLTQAEAICSSQLRYKTAEQKRTAS